MAKQAKSSRPAAWSVYLDEGSAEDLEFVRGYYAKKNDGQPVSDSQIGRNLLREKKADIINERTRSLTLARVYEEVKAMRAALEAFLEGRDNVQG